RHPSMISYAGMRDKRGQRLKPVPFSDVSLNGDKCNQTQVVASYLSTFFVVVDMYLTGNVNDYGYALKEPFERFSPSPIDIIAFMERTGQVQPTAASVRQYTQFEEAPLTPPLPLSCLLNTVPAVGLRFCLERPLWNKVRVSAGWTHKEMSEQQRKKVPTRVVDTLAPGFTPERVQFLPEEAQQRMVDVITKVSPLYNTQGSDHLLVHSRAQPPAWLLSSGFTRQVRDATGLLEPSRVPREHASSISVTSRAYVHESNAPRVALPLTPGEIQSIEDTRAGRQQFTQVCKM
ncbi:hypothetical protein KIPB_004185, partial [Kipferlia bialata]